MQHADYLRIKVTMTPDEPVHATNTSLSGVIGTTGEDLASIVSSLASRLTDDHLGVLDEPVATEEDFDRARRSLEKQRGLISKAQRIVDRRRDVVDYLHRRHTYLIQFDNGRWPDRQQALRTALDDMPEDGMLGWLSAYTVALMNWELEECLRLSEMHLPEVDDWPGTVTMRLATEALAEGRYEDVDGYLAYLAAGAIVAGHPGVDASTKSAVESLRGRLKLSLARGIEEPAESNLLAQIEAHFKSAEEMDPKSAAPHAGRAALLRLQKDYDEALDVAEEAIEIDPDAPDGHIEAGLSATEVGRLDEASEAFDRAAEILARHPSPVRATETELRPHPPLLWLKLADLLHSEGREEEALRAVTRTQALRIDGVDNPNARRYEVEAEILSALRRPDTEIAAALRWAGKERYWGGETDKAQGQLERAVELDPSNPQQYFFLSEIHLRSSYNLDASRDDRKQKVDLAKATWMKGDGQADWPRQPEDAWAFLIRARIASQEAEQTSLRHTELLWQAIVFLERNIHYQPNTPAAWAMLGMSLQEAGFVWAASVATKQAQELEPNNVTALAGRISVLIDLARLDEASELLDRRRDVVPEDEAWHDAVAGYINLLGGDWDQAAVQLDSAIRADSSAVRYRTARSQCALLRDEEGAIEGYREILKRTGVKPPRDLEVSTLLGSLEAAVYTGDEARAEVLLEWVRDERLSSRFWIGFYDAVISVIKGNIDDAVDLFTDAIDKAVKPADVLMPWDVDLPALTQASQHWSNPKSMEEFTRALDEAGVPEMRKRVAVDAVGYPLLTDVYQDAREASTDSDLDAGRLSRIEWEQTGAAAALARLYRTDGRLTEAAKWYLALADSDRFPEAGTALNEVRRDRIERTYAAFPMPVLTPVALELDGELLPLVVDDDGAALNSTFQALLTHARERISELYGVPVPGIRLREDERETSKGAYRILVNETPVDHGVLESEYRLAQASLAEISELGVNGTVRGDTPEGVSATWVRNDAWVVVEDAGFELWEITEYAVRHLEAVLKEHLKEFVGHQEIMTMIEDLPSDHAERFNDDSGALGEFTSVARMLVEEQVPLVDLDILLETFFAHRAEPGGMAALTEKLRSVPAMLPRLPGNDVDYTFYELGDDIESLFVEAIHDMDGDAIVHMEPEVVRDVLSAVRNVVGDGRRETIVVERAEIRRAVKDIIKLEFPGICVLSKTELLPQPGRVFHKIGFPI